MKSTIAQFIPILLAFAMLSFIKPFVLFSHSILGKLLAVLIIIFYSHIDKILGAFVCALVILFYQFDYVENMLNMSDTNDAEISMIDTDGVPDILDDEIYLPETDAILNRPPPKIAAEDIYTMYDQLYTDNESSQLMRAAKQSKHNMTDAGLTYNKIDSEQSSAEQHKEGCSACNSKR